MEVVLCFHRVGHSAHCGDAGRSGRGSFCLRVRHTGIIENVFLNYAIVRLFGVRIPDPQCHSHLRADIGSIQIEHTTVEALDNVRNFFQRQVGVHVQHSIDDFMDKGMFIVGVDSSRVQERDPFAAVVGGILPVKADAFFSYRLVKLHNVVAVPTAIGVALLLCEFFSKLEVILG